MELRGSVMRKILRTYWPFASNEIKSNFAYKGRFYLFIVCRIFSVFILYYLWMAIYGSSETGVLGGLTQNEMIVYIFMSFIVSSIVTISISSDIGFHVIDGSIAINLIKPINYRGSLLAGALGRMIYRFVVPSLIIWIGVELYKAVGLGLPVVSFERIILFLVSCILSFLIYVLFDFCFGMIAFITTYIFGLAIIKNAILSFLTGQLIPLTFFPNEMQKIFEFLPFSSMNYVPVMIYLGKYNTQELAFALARQGIWVIILYVVGGLIWKKVTKRLIVLGG